MTTEQKLDKILANQKLILANQAYIETLLDPVSRHAMTAADGSKREYELQCVMAENSRRDELAKAD